MPRRALCSLALCTALVAQEPATGTVEVIGPAPRPSDALLAHAGKDELLLFDVCYGVREVTGGLHRLWGELETARAEGMRALLDGMPRRCAGRTDAATVACADVAAVAAALLAIDGKPPALTAEQLAELLDVEAARAGRQRFLPEPRAFDWKDAKPIGGYAHDRHGWDGFPGLFRATIYLRRYVDTWPADTLAAWRSHTAACRGASDTAKIDLGRAESQMPILFGAKVDAAGVLSTVTLVDREWLRTQASSGARLDERLAGLFAAVRVAAPESLSDGVLRLCSELTAARPTDQFFGGMSAAQWQAKWLDAASFAYVGLREVDCLAGYLCVGDSTRGPTVIVEPLPAVWESLRWLDRRRTDPRPGDAWQRERSWIDPVLEALALQQKGEGLPAALNDALREQLLTGFRDADVMAGTTTSIEGVRGSLRRAVPQLVRVPVVWRGETKKALALRLFVEQQGPDGQWQAAAGAR